MTYKEARVYLDELSKYGSVLGLDAIRGLLRELGNPQDGLRFIHIAGTNGKGSVLAYTSTILSEAGYRVGRYVSPTVISYLERIQVDGALISEEMFAEMTSKVTDAIARLEEAGEPVPTVFEAETAIAFLYFRETQCDLVVLEAGLGGALDATNIVRNTVCAVFSSISRDHLGVIGNTIEEIAENKAGIIKPGCTVISAVQIPAVTEILRRRAAENKCPFKQAEPDHVQVLHSDCRGTLLSYKEFDRIDTVMAGIYQVENLITALEVLHALKLLGYAINDQAVRTGTERTIWPGRFACIGDAPLFILDGAHNEGAALRLRESVEDYFPGHKLILIMGVFRDKDYDAIVRLMCPLASSVYTADLPDRERGLPASELARAARVYCPQTRAYTEYKTDMDICGQGITDIPPGQDNYAAYQEASVRWAVASALREAGPDDVILAFGSLSYLHQIKEAYDRAFMDSGNGTRTDRTGPASPEKKEGGNL